MAQCTLSLIYLLKTKHEWPQRASNGLFPIKRAVSSQPLDDPCTLSEVPAIDSQGSGSQACQRKTGLGGARQERCVSEWVRHRAWQGEGPVSRKHGVAAPQLQPMPPAETWALHVFTFSLKNNNNNQTGNSAVNSYYRKQLCVLGQMQLCAVVCGLFEPYFLGGDFPSAWVPSFRGQAAAKAAGDTQGGGRHPCGQDQDSTVMGSSSGPFQAFGFHPKG